MPAPASTTTSRISFAKAGFCKPSSRMSMLAPRAAASLADATRSAETSVGATRASSSASSPTSWRQMFGGIDQDRRPMFGRRTIAAREKPGRFARSDEALRKRDRQRRLAGAAGDEIADAQNRQRRSVAGLAHAPRRDKAIGGAKRRQGRSQDARRSARLYPATKTLAPGMIGSWRHHRKREEIKKHRPLFGARPRASSRRRHHAC